MEHASTFMVRRSKNWMKSIFNAAQENGLAAKYPVSAMLKPGGKRTPEKEILTPQENQVRLDRVANPRARTFLLIERELPDTHVTAHILRHPYITRLFKAGLDIKELQYLAGHSTHYDQCSREVQTAERVRDDLPAGRRELLYPLCRKA